CQPLAEKIVGWMMSNVSRPPQAFGGFVIVASSQFGSTVDGAFFAMNLPASSRVAVDGRNIAHARVPCIVTRTPTRPIACVSGNGTSFVLILSRRPCFSTMVRAFVTPCGAEEFVNLY